MRTKRAMLPNLSVVTAVTLALLMIAGVTRAADPKKPDILIIWGDDDALESLQDAPKATGD